LSDEKSQFTNNYTQAGNRPENSVEHYCQTAERYYRNLPRPSALLHKPFMSLTEASNSLAKLAPLLDGLHLGKTMTVLDFGAGTCWLSRFLTLLGCSTVSLDVSPTALELGKQMFDSWPSLDGPLEPPRFLTFDGRHIDLADNSVDRVVCFEALHHVPNPGEILSELCRVLKPGGVAGFAEPGEHHSESPFSQAEMRNHDVLELDIVISEIWEMAKRAGFDQIRFKLFSYPTIDVSLDDRNLLLNGTVPEKVFGHLAASMHQWSIFFLQKGELTLDSRSIDALRGEVTVMDGPSVSLNNRPFAVKLNCTNSGQAVWLSSHAQGDIGTVKLGAHLYDHRMRLINFELLRCLLPRDVLPGESCDITAQIPALPQGAYVITFDLVSEHITWFEALGTIPAELRVDIRAK
jgi:SAM-dependent methyltransferase